jgi:thiol:disulfide interchange protein DsbD
MAVTSHATADVKWESDWDEAFKRARSENKPVLVSFYADWCVWCQHLESITFKDQKVAATLSERVVPLGVDIDHSSRELLQRYRIEAPPTVVVLAPSGDELGRILGYMPPTGFLARVQGILGEVPAGSSG